MATITETKITSGEIGILWMTYMEKSLYEQIVSIFAQKTSDPKAKRILEDFIPGNRKLIDDIAAIYTKEKAVIPQGFGPKDVFSDAPALFDDVFHIMFLRKISQIELAFESAHLAMSYRKDVMNAFAYAHNFSLGVYKSCTEYLTQQGVLVRPPYVTMPKEVEFIEEKKYMSGLQLYGNKRALNTLEVSYIFQILEANVFGMQLTAGFAQVAKEKEVKQYFMKGKELAKKAVDEFGKTLLESDIQPPTTWAGKATDSVVPPFSDKVMMYMSNILASSAIAGQALGMAFSMRSDLPMKLATLAKDTHDYSADGGKLMIKHKWLEEPPQMEDRNELIKANQ